MAGTLSFHSTVDVFPCPNCRETINTAQIVCAFCNAPIDRAAAEASAAATGKISQACSDASYLKAMAWSLLTFFLIMFIPFLGLAGVVGLTFLRFAIPVMVIRWWIKFGRIRTTDADFARAKRAVLVVSVVAILALLSAIPQYLRA